MLKKFRMAKNRNRLLRAKADVARDAKAWPLAAALYEIYLSHSPQDRDAPIWVQLGHARKESGDLSGALTAYHRSLEIAPGVADTHLQIGHLHKKTGMIDQAAASYAKAARLDPSLRQASQELLRLNATPDIPEDSERLLTRADLARDGGHWSEAAADYARYLDANPDDANIWPLWVQLGHARKEAGDNDGAVQAYERAIELAPDHAETHLHLGHLSKRMGAMHAAITSFANALTLDPDIGDAAQELRMLRSLASDDAVKLASTKADGGIRYAFPLPRTPEEIAFEPEFPDVYVGLSRSFSRKEVADTYTC